MDELTPQEAADLLGVSLATVLRLIAAGTLPVPDGILRRATVEGFAAERASFVQAMTAAQDGEQ